MRKDIKVSFVDNEEEDKLHDDIVDESKFIGKAKWLKIAAREKLERDHSNRVHKTNIDIPSVNNTGGIINSMEEFLT